MYHKLKNEDEDSAGEEVIEMNRLIDLKSKSKTVKNHGGSGGIRSIDYIFHTVNPNETIQRIALKYNVSVAQLRHHNRIMKDTDFYGLRVVRIPVGKFNFLSETVCDDDQPKPEQLANQQFVEDLIDVSAESNANLINIGISKYFSQNDGADYKKFLNNLSQELGEYQKLTKDRLESSSLTGGDLEDPSSIAISNQNKNSSCNCDGSDFGLSMKCLIFAVIILCILVPCYVLLNLEHFSFHNSSHSLLHDH